MAENTQQTNTESTETQNNTGAQKPWYKRVGYIVGGAAVLCIAGAAICMTGGACLTSTPSSTEAE